MYATDPAILNHCLLKFAATGDLAYDAIPLEVKTRALSVLIESWDPDWAALRGRRLSKAVQNARGNVPLEPYFGWISYISSRQGAVPQAVRDKYHCETLSGFGDLIYVTQEAFDDQDPHLVHAALDLYGLLEHEGLLNRNLRATPQL